MKILFCQPTLDRSGSEMSLVTIIEGLRTLGPDEIHILAGREGPMHGRLSRLAESCRVVQAPKLRRAIGSAPGFVRSFWTVYRAVAVLKRQRAIDVVYVNTLMFPQAVVAAALTRTPCVVHVREVEGRYPAFFYRAYWVLARRVARCVVAVSRYAGSRLHGEGPKRPIDVIYNSSGTEPAFIDRPLQGTLSVLVVGGVTRRKGADLLPDVAAALADAMEGRPFRITVVGRIEDPELYKEIMDQIASKGLSETLRFVGEQDDLIPYYEDAHVLLHPSRFEAFPRVIVEAASFAVPVVTTDVGGCPEAIASGENGFVVPADDAEALARAVARIVTDAARYRQFARAAFDGYHDSFSSGAMAARIRAVILDAVSGHGSPEPPAPRD